MTDPLILGKAQVVRESLNDLAAIPQTSYAEFESDFRNVQATLHLMQVAIQALTDLGSMLCARLGLATPRTSFEVFERLEQDGRLPKGSATRFAPIVGFRNRIVHLYDRIDQRIVFRVLTERRADLAELLGHLLAVDTCGG